MRFSKWFSFITRMPSCCFSFQMFVMGLLGTRPKLLYLIFKRDLFSNRVRKKVSLLAPTD